MITTIKIEINSDILRIEDKINTLGKRKKCKIKHMNVATIADEVFRELGEPSSLSISPITFWLRTNIGGLNSYINKSYEIDINTYEILPQIGISEVAILKQMYIVHYYDVQLRGALVNASTDAVVELESDGSRIRKINKSELGKTWLSYRNSAYDQLISMINSYKLGQSHPVQVAGDDTIEGQYNAGYEYLNRTNNNR